MGTSASQRGRAAWYSVGLNNKLTYVKAAEESHVGKERRQRRLLGAFDAYAAASQMHRKRRFSPHNSHAVQAEKQESMVLIRIPNHHSMWFD